MLEFCRKKSNCVLSYLTGNRFMLGFPRCIAPNVAGAHQLERPGCAQSPHCRNLELQVPHQMVCDIFIRWDGPLEGSSRDVSVFNELYAIIATLSILSSQNPCQKSRFLNYFNPHIFILHCPSRSIHKSHQIQVFFEAKDFGNQISHPAS